MDKKALVQALKPITDRVRKDVTAKKTEKGQSWTKDPLTDELMMRHVNGGPARGCCPIKEGESVTMIATLDMDSHKGEVAWSEMTQEALKIIDTLEGDGMFPVAFRSSGGSGIHIYLLWEQPQDAYSVRMMIKGVLSKVGYREGTKGVIAREIEIFPKQDSVEIGGYGSQVILPLAGLSEPLEPAFDLEPMGKPYASSIQWRMSADVQVLQKPTPSAPAVINIDRKTFAKAVLNGIDNSHSCKDPRGLGYEDWFKVLCGIKYMDSGEPGLNLALKWSKQCPDFDQKMFDRTWRGIKVDRGDKEKFATPNTVIAMARERGWFEDALELFDHSEVNPDDVLNFKRDKNGMIKAVIENVIIALERPSFTGFDVARDTFRDEILICPTGTNEWQQFNDADYSDLRVVLANKGFHPVGREMMRDALDSVVRKRQFDTAQLWLESIEWDGVKRIETFYCDYFEVEDTEYARSVGLYTWTALAGRVISPGVKADMVPVLVGAQGCGKSTAIAEMSPAPEFFREISFSEKDDDLSRKMRGALIAEIPELKGLSSKDSESIKAFITKRFEHWVPKFKEFSVTFPRRLIFIGTTNEDEFLSDTENRRWLPMRGGLVKTDEITAVREQLWAEGRERFKADGVMYSEAQLLAKDEHERYEIKDAWDDLVIDWLKTDDPKTFNPYSESEYLLSKDVLIGAIGMDKSRINRGYEMKISKVLQRLKYKSVRTRIDGKLTRVFRKDDDSMPF